jgi:hypothetical protein
MISERGASWPSKIWSMEAKKKAFILSLRACLDQYIANKATNGNGGLKWIERGGGYCCECNKKLKG